MSVLVARIAEDGTVYIGADTQCSRDNIIFKHSKLFTDETGTIFGYVNTVEEGQLLRIYAEDHSLANSTAKAVLEYFFAFAAWAEKYRGEWSPPLNEYIVAKDGRVFLVSDGFSVEEVTEYIAIGSGATFALGALAIGASVEEALDAASRHDIYCNAPYDIEIMEPVL